MDRTTLDLLEAMAEDIKAMRRLLEDRFPRVETDEERLSRQYNESVKTLKREEALKEALAARSAADAIRRKDLSLVLRPNLPTVTVRVAPPDVPRC